MVLRNIIIRLFVLALFCIPHAQIYALDNNPDKSSGGSGLHESKQAQKETVAMDAPVPSADLNIKQDVKPGQRISRCDGDTDFIRLQGLPLCELDFRDDDEVEHEPSIIKYRVLVEKGLDQHATAFAQNVSDVLGSSTGWEQAGLSFARVREGHDITIIMAQPRAVDRLCRPLNTEGKLSCAINGRVVINAERWLGGAQTWGDNVVGYRSYLINHEVGHLLGMSHAKCPGEGQPAPVMQQQTLDLGACVANGAVTQVDLELLQPYRSILRQRLASADTVNRLKQRPRQIVKKQPRQQELQEKHLWVPPKPPGYSLAFKLTADD
ncbi:MAG: DUF3152 domain-containing protein [Pseudomonadota bacterium]